VLGVARDQPALSVLVRDDELEPDRVGTIARNEIVPSSFLREATALFHSPAPMTVAFPFFRPLALLGDGRLPLRRGGLQHLLGLRLPVEQHLEEPAQERPAKDGEHPLGQLHPDVAGQLPRARPDAPGRAHRDDRVVQVHPRPGHFSVHVVAVGLATFPFSALATSKVVAAIPNGSKTFACIASS